MKNKIFIGALAVIIAALLWSLDGTFLRPNLYQLPSPLVVFLEHLLGFIVLCPFLFIYRREFKLIKKKEWLTIFWVALFGGALGTTFFTKALFLTGFKDISVVILLQKFQPIFAIILAAIFLHERFPKKFYLYAATAVFAGYFVTFKDPFTITRLPITSYLIPLFSLLAAFAWGSSTTFGKYSLKNINYGLLAALRFGLTVLIMALPALYFYANLIPTIASRQWITFIIIVFSSGAVAMFLYYYGLKKIPASLATLCELAWPVSAVTMDYYFNNNVLSPTQILGTIILIAAVYRTTTLNRAYTITGQIIKGQGLGGKIGIRTANLEPGLAKDLPKGLYTCQVGLGDKIYKGLLYYGYNSLSKNDCLEVHLFNFEGDLHDKQLIITTQSYMRLPKKFNSAEELTEQIKKDIESVRDKI